MMKRALAVALLASLLLAACAAPAGSGPGSAGGALNTGGTGGTMPGAGSAQTSAAPPAGTGSSAPTGQAAVATAGQSATAVSAGGAGSPNVAATVAPSAGGQSSGAAQVAYAPPKLGDAPANIRDFVILGGSILTDTQKVLAGTVGNKLNCSNCHFEGGLTQGGKNGGISLVGVGAKYPAFTTRHQGPTDLSLRTFD